MCAIFGYAGFSDKDLIKKMSKNQIFRGPDEFNYFSDDNVAIGNNRLSIIDVENGSQPISSEDERFVLVYNGMIHNFKELKKSLNEKGVMFDTNSDTEVLLQVFRFYGIEGVEKLNGMFSICLIDNVNNFTYLIRDQFGIKPLYYRKESDYIKFSSEPKTLLNSSEKISENALGQYLSYQFYLNEETLIEGIKSVNPGCYVKINNKTCSTELIRYFNLRFLDNSTKTTSIDDLEKAIIKSVELQTFADVSVGAHLSGGIDSSLVTALASKFKPDLKTFHGFFPHDSEIYSEVK